MMLDEHEWAAGLAEGEGCWTRQIHKYKGGGIYPVFKLTMTDSDVVERFAEVIKRPVGVEHTPSQKERGAQPLFVTKKAGNGVQEITDKVSPWLGLRRRSRIVELGLAVKDLIARDFAWLVGLLEGEGCFHLKHKGSPNSPLVQLQSTDKDTVEHTYALMGCTTKLCEISMAHRNPNWNTVWMARLHGIESIALMTRLLPHMGKRRAKKIDSILKGYRA